MAVASSHLLNIAQNLDASADGIFVVFASICSHSLSTSLLHPFYNVQPVRSFKKNISRLGPTTLLVHGDAEQKLVYFPFIDVSTSRRTYFVSLR